jgi:hypothetical protein
MHRAKAIHCVTDKACWHALKRIDLGLRRSLTGALYFQYCGFFDHLGLLA